MSDSSVERGRVLWFSEERGLGKVELADGRTLSFDASVAGPFEPGADVRVEIGTSRRGGPRVLLVTRWAAETVRAGPPVIANRYRLDEVIGNPSGEASSRIHKATDLETGATVVVKDLHDSRWNEESRTLYYLRREPRHPNVVAVHVPPGDPGLTEHIVMDWVDGPTLASFLAERPRRKPPVAILLMAIQICKALVAMHEAYISHGDLRPSKILLEHGDPERVRIIGFGLARALDQVHVPVYLPRSTTRRVWYSPASELPPQQTDLHSLGLILAEMVTGERVHQELESLRGGPPRLSESVHMSEFDYLIRKATGNSPDGRYKTAQEMLDDLV
jgi:eukaryotic-like serine/threonine-protein kinase